MAKEIKVGEYTQDEIEDLFGKIAAKSAQESIDKNNSEWEKKLLAQQETHKTALRSEFMDVFAANQHNDSKGLDDKNPQTLLGMYAMTLAKANFNDGPASMRDMDRVGKYAKEMFPSAKNFHGLIAAQKKDLEASIPSAGGFTIPSILSPDIIRVLYNNTILDRVGAVKVPMPNGNFKMARMDASSGTFWGNELPTGNKTEPVFGDISLSAKKLTALVPISNSLLRYNAVGLDSWVSQDLQMKARIALDTAMLYGTGTLGQPLGLMNQGVQTSGTSSTAFALGTPNDMKALLKKNNVPMIKPAWILNPLGESNILDLAFSSGPFAWAQEMNTSERLAGIPYVSSASVQTYSSDTYADYWLGDFSEFVWGVGYDLSLEISREGTYINGGTTYSAFQRDESLIRLICEHDFGVKHPVSFIQGTYTI